VTRVVVVHQYDPTVSAAVGGVEVFINTFVKYAPQDIEMRMVGIASDAHAHPVGRWQSISVGGRRVEFFPLLAAQPGRSPGLPLSAKFTWALMRSRRELGLEDAILTFHRIEPTLPVRNFAGRTVLFLHAHSKDLDNPTTEVTWSKAPGVYRWLEARLIAGVARIFVVREDAAADYRARYAKLASRIEFLPTSVDDAVFQAWDDPKREATRRSLAARYGLDATRPWVLFVGRFEAAKDPLLALEAMRHMAGAGRRAQLVMIGRGTLEPRIRAYIDEHRLGECARLLGPQPQSELASWLNAGDCLCMSSAFEGMPLAMLEALQCGLRVVSTAAGGESPRILRAGAGLLVPERSAPALARGIDEVLSRAPDRGACQTAAAPYAARTALAALYAKYREIRLQ